MNYRDMANSFRRASRRGVTGGATPLDTAADAIMALVVENESLQSQLAAANERADRYKEFWEATLLDCREAGERADVKAAAHSDMAEMYRKEKERADGLQRIVDEARAQKPVCITTLDDFCTVVAYPPPNVLHSVPLYAAAPVPAQPAVVPKHAADRIHEMRDVLFDIATSDVMGDRPEHSFVTVAINRDTLSRAAILSATEGLKDGW